MLLLVIRCAGVESESRLVQKWLIGRFFSELSLFAKLHMGLAL